MSIFSSNAFKSAILSVTGSTSIIAGTTMQKVIHNKNADLPTEEQIPCFYRWDWWLGLSLFAFGGLCDFCATLFASSSAIVTGFGGTCRLVCSLCIAMWYLEENVGFVECTGVLFMIATAVTLTVDIYEDSEVESWNELMENFNHHKFLIYGSITFLHIILVMIHLNSVEIYSWFAQVFNCMDEDEENTDKKTEPHWYDCYLWASISGISGGYSLLIASCVGKAIVLAYRGDNIPWWSYFLIIFTFSAIALQTYSMNKSFGSGDLTVSVPSCQSCFCVSGVISGTLFFKNEFVKVLPLGLMAIGFAIIMQHEPTQMSKTNKMEQQP